MNLTTEQMIEDIKQKYGEHHEYVLSLQQLSKTCVGVMEPLISIIYDELMNKAD